MIEASESQARLSRLPPPSVRDLEEPAGAKASSGDGSSGLTPAQRVFFYSSDEWEEFLRECATVMTRRYHQVKRLGGTNDEGVDIAGFKSPAGFEGSWDCWQGKHYSGALSPGDVLPEILKLLRHVVEGSYVLPDAYYFAAPRGCGTSLSRLLSKPTSLRAHFLDALRAGKTLTNSLERDELDRVLGLAQDLDFSLFRSVEMHELMALHQESAYHQSRFGGALKERPEPPAVAPMEICSSEARYVEQLLEVYAEACPGEDLDLPSLPEHARVGDHFRRQRLSFYSAESLRLYARDSVPPGTYERLQDDIHDSVLDTAEADYATGLDRLRHVLTASAQTDLSAHPLISVSRIRDRHGVCHQLANQDRLHWVVGGQ